MTLSILVVAMIGLADATYLTYVHYVDLQALLCVGAHDGHSSCITVQSSPWAQLAGIPVALLGALAYVALLLSLAVPGDVGKSIGFGIAAVGFGFSMYLSFREVYTIHAICEWCVASAVCMTVLVVLMGVRVASGGELGGARI